MQTKKISLIFALILLMVVLTIPASAELDYEPTTPVQAPITLDDLDVPLTEFEGEPGNENSSGASDTPESLEIDNLPVPLGDVSPADPVVSLVPKTVPQTGFNAFDSIVLGITSVLGSGTAAFFILRKRKVDKI